MNLLPVAILGGAAWWLSRLRRNPSTNTSTNRIKTPSLYSLIPPDQWHRWENKSEQDRQDQAKSIINRLFNDELKWELHEFHFVGNGGYVEREDKEGALRFMKAKGIPFPELREALWKVSVAYAKKVKKMDDRYKREQPMREAAAYARRGGR